MSLKGRLEKLEPKMLERWRQGWEAYMEACLESAPRAAVDLIADGSLTLEDVTPAEADRLEQRYKARLAELGLDGEAWERWGNIVQSPADLYAARPAEFPSRPEALPGPPGDPGEALAAVRAWSYPDTLEGLYDAALALMLAEAAVIWERRQGKQE